MIRRGITRMQHEVDGQMGEADRQHMHRTHHEQTIWIYFLIILLGVWLVSSPFILGYGQPAQVAENVARVTAERNLAPIGERATALTWSDIISGLLLVAFGALSLRPRFVWAQWAACLVGIWLLFAPLIFWAPSAAAYANDTLVGMLVIALTILIPGMPGMILIMKMGPETPPGWSYNPSSWFQRAPIIVLAWLGFFLARYMASYQFGHIDSAWDPLFGDATMRVLDSEVSHAWPISDAGLGAVAYTVEALMAYMGGTNRWRTMPWMVTFFGIVVVPLGLVHVVLVVLQPVVIGLWCTLCLLAAFFMLLMIPLTVDEVLAMGQFLARSKREGKSLWRTFFLGGTIEGGGQDKRSPDVVAPLQQAGPAMLWGVTLPWTLVASAVLGIWLMFSPGLFQTQGTLFANSAHLAGALVTVVAVTALAEIVRAARFVNVLAGLWIIAAPWLLSGATSLAAWHAVVLGTVLILLSIPRGKVRERYAGWNRYIV